MSKLFKFLVIVLAAMSLVSCDGYLCELGSRTACIRYDHNYEK